MDFAIMVFLCHNRRVFLLFLSSVLLLFIGACTDGASPNRDARQSEPSVTTTPTFSTDSLSTTAILSPTQEISHEEIENIVQVMQKRANALNIGDVEVQILKEEYIRVNFPRVADPERVVDILRGRGRLEFIDTQGQWLPAGMHVRTTNNPDLPKNDQESDNELLYTSIIESSELDVEQIQFLPPDKRDENPQHLEGEPAISFAFRGESAKNLEDFTSQHVGMPLCIVLDNVIISCSIIQSVLTDGAGIFTTNTIDERDRIYIQLKFGTLPTSLQIESIETIERE